MTKEEMLQKAERDYPKDTKHGGYGNVKEGFISTGKFKFSGPDIRSVDEAGDTVSGCIYFGEGKRWATVYSTPNPIQNYEIY